MALSLEKTKFGRKATEDMESMSSVDEVMDSEALLIGEILISLKIFHCFFNIANYLQVKKGRGRPSKGRREAPCDRGR